MDHIKEDICRKLRLTAAEFGQKSLTGARVLSCYDYDSVGRHEHITIPTLSIITLANVSFKVARFFEDI